MAKIEVGCQLSWQGRKAICTSIATETVTMVSSYNTENWRQLRSGHSNVKTLAEEWGDFDAGDIVKLEYQRVTLEIPGEHMYYIFPYFKVRKETISGSTTTEGSNRQATGGEVEADRGRDQGGAGDGKQSTGEDRHAAD